MSSDTGGKNHEKGKEKERTRLSEKLIVALETTQIAVRLLSPFAPPTLQPPTSCAPPPPPTTVVRSVDAECRPPWVDSSLEQAEQLAGHQEKRAKEHRQRSIENSLAENRPVAAASNPDPRRQKSRPRERQ